MNGQQVFERVWVPALLPDGRVSHPYGGPSAAMLLIDRMFDTLPEIRS